MKADLPVTGTGEPQSTERRVGGWGVSTAERDLGVRRDYAIALLLVFATAFVYLPVRWFGFLLFDDADYVTANPMVRRGLTWVGLRWAFTSMSAANWHPLTWLSHMLDVQLFGTSATGPHAVNVCLHAANAVLVFILFRQLTGYAARSAAVAALFALHPLRIESVAWVAERKDVLCGFFFLLSLLAYARHCKQSSRAPELQPCRAGSPDPAVADLACNLNGASDSHASDATAGSGDPALHQSVFPQSASHRTLSPSLSLPWWSLIFFVLALLAKPMAVTLPFVLLLLDYWPFGRLGRSGEGERSDFAAKMKVAGGLLLEKLPFFALSAASCVVTYLAQNRAGVVRSADALPLAARVANASVSYVRYLEKLVWPADLAIFYPHPGQWPARQVIASMLVLAVLTVGALRFARRHGFAFVGWAWFLGMLVPAIGLVQVSEQAMADRYSYLPSIGIFVAVVWTVATLVARYRWSTIALTGATAIVLVAAAAGTRRQLRTWQDGETLFRHALAVTERNAPAHYNLANELANVGRTDEAIAEYRRALEVNPHYADAQCNLGTALLRKGDTAAAVAAFRRTIEVQPNHVVAHCDLGLTLLDSGRTDEAIAEFRAAAALPTGGIGFFHLGNVALRQGRIADAIANYEKALAADPGNADAHNNLAAALLRAGRSTEALRHFARALELRPRDSDTNSNFADVLLQRGLIDQAAARYAIAVEARPENVDAHCGWGTALLMQGRLDAARREFEKTLALQPDSLVAHNNLAGILLRQGQAREAIGHLRAALRLEPDNVRTLTSTAWVLSTCSDAAVRDGGAAVALAQRADQLSGKADARVVRALGAAYAEAGQFAEAIAAVERGVRLAEAQSDGGLAELLRTQLKQYRSGVPWRDTPSKNGS